MSLHLCRMVLLVRDFDRAVEFYRDTLGLAPQAVHPGWAVFATGEALLCLRGPWEGMAYAPEDFGRSPDELLFRVDDLAATVAALEQKGVRVGAPHEPGPGIRVAELQDPDGRRIALEQRNSVG